jgi:MerR family transcriptional regulator, light-induced transcriptional regulator
LSEELQVVDNHIPVYNIKAVARLVGLLPVTLRAWERRYGLPIPKRGDQGYRLYSEYDVRTLRWLKSQIDTGLSIGRATDLLHDMRLKGLDPANEIDRPIEQIVSPDALRDQFQNALSHFDEVNAGEALRRAFSLYAIDQVMLDIIQPVLVSFGEAWHRGELPVVVEHFATQFCMQNLNSMLAAATQPYASGVIVAACAPGETHQIGLMMVVTVLRWRGWDVKYMGPDLMLDKMVEALDAIHPRLLLFSATRVESARSLSDLPRIMTRFTPPIPKVALGGQAFCSISAGELPGIYLNGPLTEMVQKIEDLMKS